VAELAARLRERAAQALARGALAPIPTAVVELEDGGLRFQVRVAEALRRKPRGLEPAGGHAANPFLPFDPELFVGDVSRTHVALLNKFPVIADHLLVVTRAFEEQESPLGAADFGALARCLDELGGLAFYNAGAAAGASQRHKHLQLVPLRAPLEAILAEAARAGLERAPRLPWAHGVAATGEVAGAAPRYRALLAALGLDAPRRPYNLLLTRDWMCVVPRAREHFGDAPPRVSVNALGFAGALFAGDAAELARIRVAGPLALLRAVAG
jgi:ATP adenylyltransferase